MPTHTFTVNGTQVSVDVEDDVRLLWVLRDLLGITGPKYGCGLSVCQACTSHINGERFNPCAVPVGALRDDDEITTIEGLADTVDSDLHPVQQAWLDHDVAQCGYCQPGQIMTAVALIEAAHREGRVLTDADLDEMRNVCRCGTYPRIRAAVLAAAAAMAAGTAVSGSSAGPAAAVVAGADAEVDAAQVDAAQAAAPSTARLPATGTSVPLTAAAAAGGAAVAIRSVVRRASGAEPTTSPDADA